MSDVAHKILTWIIVILGGTWDIKFLIIHGKIMEVIGGIFILIVLGMLLFYNGNEYKPKKFTKY